MKMRVLFPSIFLSLALVACGSPEDKVKTPVQAAAQTKPVVAPPPTRAKLSPDANGKKFYKKCVACHLANGDGIPGAFPPLNSGMDELASTEAGREYLVLVIYNGLRGKLETKNGSYNGTMVRQAGGKSPADVADVLNHVFASFYPDNGLKAFSADEVARINEAHGRLGGTEVLDLRPKEKE